MSQFLKITENTINANCFSACDEMTISIEHKLREKPQLEGLFLKILMQRTQMIIATHLNFIPGMTKTYNKQLRSLTRPCNKRLLFLVTMLFIYFMESNFSDFFTSNNLSVKKTNTFFLSMFSKNDADTLKRYSSKMKSLTSDNKFPELGNLYSNAVLNVIDLEDPIVLVGFYGFVGKTLSFFLDYHADYVMGEFISQENEIDTA
jgi:hypothetical protein